MDVKGKSCSRNVCVVNAEGERYRRIKASRVGEERENQAACFVEKIAFVVRRRKFDVIT